MARRLKVDAEKPITPVHVFANEMAELLAIVRPFFIWPMLAVSAVLLRSFWPDNIFVIIFLSLAAVIVPVLAWLMELGKDRNITLFAHSVASGALVAGTLIIVDVLGYTSHQYIGLFMILFGLPLLCLTWSVRGAIAEKQLAAQSHMQNYFDIAGMPDTHLKIHEKPQEPKAKKEKKVKKVKAKKKRWSLRTDDEGEPVTPVPVPVPVPVAKPVLTGKVRTRPKEDKRVRGTINMAPGLTHEDAVKNIRSVESAAGFPPGSFSLTPNLDHAGRSDVIISDPRVITNPVMYPGPSYVGGSIADPISTGIYQDSTEAEWTLPHTMVQIMGMINSGKSLGGGWSILAEAITRNDCVVWGADITKGYQTLGPLAPALHRMENTPKGVRIMLEDMNKLIKPRTNYLAEHGLGKWQKGCGLNYLVVWLEEIPDIVRDIGHAGKDMWIRSVKAGRSAGITIVWSLQRADFREIPTIARGQSVKMCFGVSDPSEAKFGLSSAQLSAGCEPELWGQRKQGMCYLDAPSVPDDYVPMAMRTWYWGETDTLIKAHAAKYPISQRPYDDLMIKVLGSDTPPVMETPPTVVEPMDTQDARMQMRSWLLSMKGTEIANSDVIEQAKRTGYQKGWGYKVMAEFVNEGMASKSGEGHWFVNDEDDLMDSK